MKTESKEKIALANRLAQVIAMRRTLEREEHELKDYFREEIYDGVLQAGSITIFLEEGERDYIDKDRLIRELGESVKRFFNKVKYVKVLVRTEKELDD